MVFKKFEKNNLFHMSCSDVRERFHYIILLLVVIVQTMKEYSWSEKQFWILLPDCLWVLVAEMFVDYFKHAFVTRFNDIPYDVYEDYSISLAYDLVGSKLKSVCTQTNFYRNITFHFLFISGLFRSFRHNISKNGIYSFAIICFSHSNFFRFFCIQ